MAPFVFILFCPEFGYSDSVDLTPQALSLMLQSGPQGGSVAFGVTGSSWFGPDSGCLGFAVDQGFSFQSFLFCFPFVFSGGSIACGNNGPSCSVLTMVDWALL